MLKITFHPNEFVVISGSYINEKGHTVVSEEIPILDFEAECKIKELTEQNKEGTIEACIVVERKPGAYNLPKLDRVNSIFG